MSTDIDYINAALTRTGNSPITSLTDGTLEATVSAHNYDLLVRQALSSYRWRWAAKTATLNQITGTPAPPWQYAYQLPTDLIAIRTVKVGGAVVAYERQYDTILTDADGGTDVILHYTWQPPEPFWPDYFVELMTIRLEALYLRAIGERYEEAEARQRIADREVFPRARLIDAQAQPPSDRRRYPIVEARRG